MRIAFVGCRHLLSDYSGIERGLVHLGPALVRRGHEVAVFGGRIADRRKATDRHEGVAIVEVPALSGKHGETLSRTALAVALAAKGGFDVVHFTHQAPAIFAPLAKAAGMATVVTTAGLDWRRAKWGRVAKLSIRAAERVAVHCVDEIIVLAKAHAEYFHRAYRRSTVRVPNGLAPKPPPENADEVLKLGLRPRDYVLFAARLVPEKACHELVDAWSLVKTEKRLVIAGAGEADYVAGLKRAADPEKVLFLGHVTGSRLEQLFGHAYLFVLPSHLEGLSVALLESMAHGVPALVSDIRENVEVVEEDGFVFRVGDVGHLGETLAALLADERRVRAMTERVRQAARAKCSWDTVAALHDEIYRDLADREAFLRRMEA